MQEMEAILAYREPGTFRERVKFSVQAGMMGEEEADRLCETLHLASWRDVGTAPTGNF